MLPSFGYKIILTLLLDILVTMDSSQQLLEDLQLPTPFENVEQYTRTRVDGLNSRAKWDRFTDEKHSNEEERSQDANIYKRYLIEAVGKLQEDVLANNVPIQLNGSILERFKEMLQDDGYEIEFKKEGEEMEDGNESSSGGLNVTTESFKPDGANETNANERLTDKPVLPIYLKPFNLSNNFSVQILIDVHEEDDDEDDDEHGKIREHFVERRTGAGSKEGLGTFESPRPVENINRKPNDSKLKRTVELSKSAEHLKMILNKPESANQIEKTIYDQSIGKDSSSLSPNRKENGDYVQLFDLKGPQIQNPLIPEESGLHINSYRFAIDELKLGFAKETTTEKPDMRKLRPLRRQGAFYFKGFPENLRNNKSRIENIRERCRLVTTSWNGVTLECDETVHDVNSIPKKKAKYYTDLPTQRYRRSIQDRAGQPVRWKRSDEESITLNSGEHLIRVTSELIDTEAMKSEQTTVKMITRSRIKVKKKKKKKKKTYNYRYFTPTIIKRK